jgi:hypothetical protein
MMNMLLESLSTYYGLDWVSLTLGLIGMSLITKKKKAGFIVSGLAYAAGLATAVIADQYGFVFYNTALIFLMVKGHRKWGKPVSA